VFDLYPYIICITCHTTAPQAVICDRENPPFLHKLKATDMLPSSMVGHELGNKIKEFQHHCFHVTLSLITGTFQLTYKFADDTNIKIEATHAHIY
jgi:hypothetical protein